LTIPIRSLCVFCGSSPGTKPEYVQTAESLGRLLAERNIELIFGGGSVGMMGAVARATLAAGGKATGVIPRALLRKEIAQSGLSHMHVVESMHERKALMAKLSDGFVALPGGYGTLEEFFEVLTWAQLGFHHKPVALLDVAGFYAPMITLLEHMITEGFVRPNQLGLIITETNAEKLIARLENYEAPETEPWIAGGQT
jgi:uncharacterized protein (TIGR00730 family)